MLHNSTKSILDLLFALMVVAGTISLALWRRLSVTQRLSGSTAPDTADSSTIIAYFTAGHDLVNAGRGSEAGMRFSTYLTGPLSAEHGQGYSAESAIIYALDLPFNTQTHVVGLSKEFKLDRLQFASFLQGQGMQAQSLEGDFPDYFDLYSAPGQDLNVRLVLDPDSMSSVIQYCKSYFWEIHNAQLYLAIPESSKGGSNFIAESVQFVQSIRPALAGTAAAAPVHHEVPYGEYDGPPLPCPICKQTMELHDASWFSCPAGHGALLTGADLERLDKHTLDIQADATKAAAHADLTCPNCHNPMSQVAYQGGRLQIDSCTHCPYRWLDANELEALANPS